MITLSDLHDATLESISFDWAAAVVFVRFKVHGIGAAGFEAKDVFNVNCPRLLPWGPSNSVNSVELQAQSGCQCLTIEMQSGDVLEISCREVVDLRISE